MIARIALGGFAAGILWAWLVIPMSQQTWAAPLLVDRIKIAVNKKAITEREFQLLKQVRERELRQQLQGRALQEQLRNLGKNLQQELVESLLLEDHAERLSLSVSNSQVERQMELLRQRSAEILKKMGEAQARQLVVRQLLSQRVVRQEVAAKILVSEEQVAAACKEDSSANYEVDVGHILRKESSAAQRKRLLQLRQQLLSGANFAALAQRHSEDPSVKQNKGRLGYVQRGQLVLPFEEAAFALRPGQVSSPVKTRFGLHLIMVFNRRQAGQRDCNQITLQERQRLSQQIRQHQQQQRLQKLLLDLRNRSDVQVQQ